MADNTQINTGSGDLIRGLDKAGVKTQVMSLDIGGTGVESLLSSTNPMPVTGSLSYSSTLAQGLTDAQLRASPVPVSGSLSIASTQDQPLTDTQLRATAVSVSGTVSLSTGTLDALETVSIANFPATQPVSGPLTDTQLRATAVPVSGSVGLTSGSSTVSITNTFSNPAAVRLSDGSTWLNTVPVSGTFFPTTQPVSIATTVAVSAPVAAPVFVRLSDGTSAISTLGVSMTQLPTALVSGRLDVNLGAATTSSTLPVSLASLPALSSGTAVIGAISGDVAHDTTDTSSGVVKVGSKAIISAIGGGLPAAVLGNERAQIAMDVYGRIAARDNDSWSRAHLPASGAQATCNSSAQAAGVRNVCRAITLTLSSTAVPTVNTVTFSLYDGTTAGTVLWGAKGSLTAVAGDTWGLSISGLWIEGTAATQMTLATAAATTTNVAATVAMSGTITQ